MNSNLHKMEPDKLIEACKKGDHRAQVEIYKRYYKAMYNIALRIINDTAEAEDVMQESFLKAFSKLDTFSGEVTFGAWLKKIVVNKSLDAIKTRKTLISLESVPELPDNSGSENYLDYRELNIDMVKQAIYRLPDGYRVVLSLYLVEGYDHDEISEILGISNATSRTQYHRARKHLAKKLNELKAVS
jgi:RNA polymerase sigma factor (sigma-70 family)